MRVGSTLGSASSPTSRLSPDACRYFFEGNFGGSKNCSCAILDAVLAVQGTFGKLFMHGGDNVRIHTITA